ncbi:S9 family peptidase [Gallaecimonas mangrovi]|uniref:S9 family peptidase n=1 Tax=Gallaecimonas mangrovi TaxID=2291597 RepID=UPI000E1FDE9F|nr:alpha/beta fold hydrolase [Gallaecimonas mangrovi]
MKFLPISLLATLAVAGCASTQPTSATTPVYDATAIFNTISYKNLSLSANGQQALLSSDQSGQFNVYAKPLSGGPAKPLLKNSKGTRYAVSWFPHSTRFLFEQDGGGNELFHIYVKDSTGQHDLIKGKQARGEFHGFSGDGKAFFMLTNERDPRQMDLYRYDAKTYQRRLVFKNTKAFAIDAISADGHYAALSKINNNADTDLYLVNLTVKNPVPRLIGNQPGIAANFVGKSFGPKSQQLYYTSDANSDLAELWSYNLATGAKHKVATAPGDIVSFAFSNTGRYQVIGYNAHERIGLELIDTQSQQQVKIKGLPTGDIDSVQFSHDDALMAFYQTSDTSPANLYSYRFKDQRLTALTSALNPHINPADLVKAQSVHFASFDGLSIPALLYKPHNASPTHKTPVVLWIHGGPGGQSRHGYRATIQYLVNNGYAILAVNNRGSEGYGKRFYHLDDRRHGEDDLMDLVKAKDYLTTLPWVDSQHIGILGGSYGGYLAVAALAFHPNVFAAGIDIFGVTNWPRTLASIPPWWEVAKNYLYSEMGDPFNPKDKARLERISPLMHSQGINKPLLVMQGANDPRVLPRESKELVAELQKRQVPVEYVELAGEGHGFKKTADRIKAAQTYLHFLQRYLP